MSGVNKNFVVKNGLEVNTNLIYADLNQDTVGIGTTTTPEKLQVNGGIGATSIVVTGIGTFPTVKGEDLYYNDAFINTGVVTSITGTISTYTTSNVNTLNATTGNIVTGVVTSISGTDLTYNDGHFSIVNTGTDLVDNLYAVSGIITTATITNGTVTNLTGTAATIGTVQIASGIVTSATGIVTYYGDGQYLNLTANPSRGIGIATVGGVVGYAATFINFYGAGISTSLFDSSVGIATIYFEGGGSGTIGIGSTFPGTPASIDPAPSGGDLFYHINYGRIFIYYDEVELGVGSTAVWIDAAPFNQAADPVLAGVAFSTGSAVSPSLYFVGDTQTGFFSPNPGDFTIVSAGSSILNVNESGIVVTGIVTSNGAVVGSAVTINSTGIDVTGVVTATSFSGDGSNLIGVSGFATALSNDQLDPLNLIFKTPEVLNIAAGTSITVESDNSSGNTAFTRCNVLVVGAGATFHVSTGTTFVLDVLNVF